MKDKKIMAQFISLARTRLMGVKLGLVTGPQNRADVV